MMYCGFVVSWDDRIVLCSVVWLWFVFFSLSVLATQGSRPEMVYRCIASVFFSFPVLAIQVFAREKVCRCTVALFRFLPLVTTPVFSPEKVCRCTSHILRP